MVLGIILILSTKRRRILPFVGRYFLVLVTKDTIFKKCTVNLIFNPNQVEDLKKQCSSLKTLTERQEQVLSKKEKQIQEQNEDIKDLKRVQDAIFNLSKNRNGSTSGAL